MKWLGEVAFREEYEIFDIAWGGSILDQKLRLFEAFQQGQNQKFSKAVQLKWTALNLSILLVTTQKTKSF